MDSFCRLCGSEDGIRVKIFEPGADHVKKIHKILPITVNEHDPFSKTMCHRCTYKVNEFFEFRTTCIKTLEFFKSKVPCLRDKRPFRENQDHPPMVEFPLNSMNRISPNEKARCGRSDLTDEDESMITIIDDDSPAETENSQMGNSLSNDVEPRDKIIMTIKRCQIKKKPKSRSIWDTKKRKRKPQKSCRIAEVFTTTLGDYQSFGSNEEDPLRLSPVDKNDNENMFSSLSKNPVTDHNTTEMNFVLKKDKTEDDIALPEYILITNIPRVGLVYTCEKCGRTFLSPQPASLHTCNCDIDFKDNYRPKEEEQDVPSSNHLAFYKCSLCDEGFSRQSQLATHHKKHEKPESSSDENFTPSKQRKKRRMYSKKKPESCHVTANDFLSEPSIFRHSLLSSDSD